MTERGLFVAQAGGFVPFDQRGRNLLDQQIRKNIAGKPVFMSVRTARNPEFSALAHVVFTKLADALGVPMEAIKVFLKEQTGRYDLVKLPGGTVVKLPHSVSFAAMSEEQFRAFWDDCLPVIFEKLLGGVSSKEYDDIMEAIQGKR